MAEQVSIELAKALQAGLRRDWQQGDWYALQHPATVAMVENERRVVWLKSFQREYPNSAVWLPRADDLLQELAECRALVSVSRADWRPPNTYLQWQVDVCWDNDHYREFRHASLAEAAGQAMLAVLQAKKKVQVEQAI